MIEMHQMAHARSARLARHAHQLEKGSDHELLREMIGYVAQRMMEMDVDGVVGAGHGERAEGRENWRNGHRERDWHTRSGTIPLRIPKLRRGSYFGGLSGTAPVVGEGAGGGDPGSVRAGHFDARRAPLRPARKKTAAALA